MQIRPYQPTDNDQLIFLIAGFRTALAELRQIERPPDIAAAREELTGYFSAKYPIFVAEYQNTLAGYLVCRVEEDVVWAESLFVKPEHRRRGIAAALYAEGEKLADMLGSGTLYNWVHPNNDAIIQFLKKRGYNTLNLIEIRRPRPRENTTQTIQVGEHQFKY